MIQLMLCAGNREVDDIRYEDEPSSRWLIQGPNVEVNWTMSPLRFYQSFPDKKSKSAYNTAFQPQRFSLTEHENQELKPGDPTLEPQDIVYINWYPCILEDPEPPHRTDSRDIETTTDLFEMAFDSLFDKLSDFKFRVLLIDGCVFGPKDHKECTTLFGGVEDRTMFSFLDRLSFEELRLVQHRNCGEYSFAVLQDYAAEAKDKICRNCTSLSLHQIRIGQYIGERRVEVVTKA